MHMYIKNNQNTDLYFFNHLKILERFLSHRVSLIKKEIKSQNNSLQDQPAEK